MIGTTAPRERKSSGYSSPSCRINTSTARACAGRGAASTEIATMIVGSFLYSVDPRTGLRVGHPPGPQVDRHMRVPEAGRFAPSPGLVVTGTPHDVSDTRAARIGNGPSKSGSPISGHGKSFCSWGCVAGDAGGARAQPRRPRKAGGQVRLLREPRRAGRHQGAELRDDREAVRGARGDDARSGGRRGHSPGRSWLHSAGAGRTFDARAG